MAIYTFIAAHKDHNCILTNVNDGIETIDELKDTLVSDIEEAYELFGSRWRIEFEDVDVDDLNLTEEEFEELSNEVLEEVEKNYIN